MNILLQFALDFYNFGESYVSNRGWSYLIRMSKMVNRVQGKNEYSRSRLSISKIYRKWESGSFLHVRLHRPLLLQRGAELEAAFLFPHLSIDLLFQIWLSIEF